MHRPLSVVPPAVPELVVETVGPLPQQMDPLELVVLDRPGVGRVGCTRKCADEMDGMGSVRHLEVMLVV